MKNIKIITILICLSTVSFANEIFDQITKTMQRDLGKDFNVEYAAFRKSTSYKELINLANREYSIVVVGKKKVSAPKFDNIFYGLKAIDARTNSIIPSLYAYYYMQWSYGNKNRNFNRAYGYYFANKLASKGNCQGYLWLGKLGETNADEYVDSYNNYKKALKVCRGESRVAATHGYALMHYFIKRKTKR